MEAVPCFALLNLEMWRFVSFCCQLVQTFKPEMRCLNVSLFQRKTKMELIDSLLCFGYFVVIFVCDSIQCWTDCFGFWFITTVLFPTLCVCVCVFVCLFVCLFVCCQCGITALSLATNIDVVHLLLNNGANVNDYDFVCWHLSMIVWEFVLFCPMLACLLVFFHIG